MIACVYLHRASVTSLHQHPALVQTPRVSLLIDGGIYSINASFTRGLLAIIKHGMPECCFSSREEHIDSKLSSSMPSETMFDSFSVSLSQLHIMFDWLTRLMLEESKWPEREDTNELNWIVLSSLICRSSSEKINMCSTLIVVQWTKWLTLNNPATVDSFAATLI